MLSGIGASERVGTVGYRANPPARKAAALAIIAPLPVLSPGRWLGAADPVRRVQVAFAPVHAGAVRVGRRRLVRLDVLLHHQEPSEGDNPKSGVRIGDLPADPVVLTPPSFVPPRRPVVAASAHLRSRPAGVLRWLLAGRRRGALDVVLDPNDAGHGLPRRLSSRAPSSPGRCG